MFLMASDQRRFSAELMTRLVPRFGRSAARIPWRSFAALRPIRPSFGLGGDGPPFVGRQAMRALGVQEDSRRRSVPHAEQLAAGGFPHRPAATPSAVAQRSTRRASPDACETTGACPMEGAGLCALSATLARELGRLSSGGCAAWSSSGGRRTVLVRNRMVGIWCDTLPRPLPVSPNGATGGGGGRLRIPTMPLPFESGGAIATWMGASGCGRLVPLARRRSSRRAMVM